MQYKSEAIKTIRLAIPVILGEMAQMSLHLIDTAMIGAVGYKQLAAAALVLNAINIPFVLGIGITISVAQMVSMAHGKFDRQLVSHYLYNGFWLCAVSAIVIGGFLLVSIPLLYHLKQNEEVVVLAIPFMKLMSVSIIPMILFLTLKQFADGLQYTKTAMILSISAIPINILLNWLLIYGNWGFPRLELVGAGYATLITRTIIFIALALVILKHKIFKRYIIVAKNQWRLQRKTMLQLLRIGVPSSLQIGMEAGAFAVSAIMIGTISAKAQAAHQIAISCATFTYMISMGLSQAGSIRTSHAYGSKNWKRIDAIGKSTLFMAFVYGLFCALIFILFRNRLPFLFNNDQDVVAITTTLLLLAAIFQISDAIQVGSAGLLRGIKDVNIPTVIVAVAYWVLAVPVGYILAFHFHLGATGIWIGFIAGLIFSATFLSMRLFISIKKRI